MSHSLSNAQNSNSPKKIQTSNSRVRIWLKETHQRESRLRLSTSYAVLQQQSTSLHHLLPTKIPLKKRPKPSIQTECPVPSRTEGSGYGYGVFPGNGKEMRGRAQRSITNGIGWGVAVTVWFYLCHTRPPPSSYSHSPSLHRLPLSRYALLFVCCGKLTNKQYCVKPRLTPYISFHHLNIFYFKFNHSGVSQNIACYLFLFLGGLRKE